jgi:ABC-2 type transport system permease protein
MNTDKIWEIMKKEWSEVFKNKIVLFAVAFMPLLFTAIPLTILASTQGSGEVAQAMSVAEDMPNEFAAVCGSLTGGDCTQFFLVSQFIILFLMMPIIIPVTIASYSIVGEKTTRTLEPLLATPLTTLELLAGKAFAAVVPALTVTWLSYIAFMTGTYYLASQAVFMKLLEPVWLLAIFGLGPLLSVAGVSIAVMISSRVNDPRIAEQLSSLVVLPLLGLFMGQSFGLFTVNEVVIIWIALILLVIDIGLLYFATQLFQRETILTRWK